MIVLLPIKLFKELIRFLIFVEHMYADFYQLYVTKEYESSIIVNKSI